MNVLDACLRRIRRKIPQAILRAAFAPAELRLIGVASSIENEIHDKVFREFLIPEISRLGQYIELDISTCRYEADQRDPYSRTYFLDDNVTGGRQIIAAHLSINPISGMAYSTPPAGSYVNGYATGVTSGMQKIVDSNSPLPKISSARVIVRGPNVIKIQDPGMFIYGTRIMAQYAISEEMNEIKPAFFGLVEDLAEFACKSVIYNNVILDIEAGKLEHGLEMGTFRSIVESYSDAGQMFDDTIPALARGLVFNDDAGQRYVFQNSGRFAV